MKKDDSVYSSAILMAGQAFHLLLQNRTLGDLLLHCNQAKAMGRSVYLHIKYAFSIVSIQVVFSFFRFFNHLLVAC